MVEKIATTSQINLLFRMIPVGEIVENNQIAVVTATRSRGRQSRQTENQQFLMEMQRQQDEEDKKSAWQIMGQCNIMVTQHGATNDQIAEAIASRNIPTAQMDRLINGLTICGRDTANEYKELTCCHPVMIKVIICVTDDLSD
jgi:hypothetical protein